MVKLRSTGIAFAIQQKVAIEVDVVLICASEPRHAVRIEDVNKHDRILLPKLRRRFEKSDLHRRAGERFDTMHTARV